MALASFKNEMEFEDNQQSQAGDASENGGDSTGGGGGSNNGADNREKERDRRGRGARGTRFSDAEGGNRERSREKRNCRVYISNIPYDYRWQDLKDLFRRIVGSVEYVELFHDESGKARGCGIVEFKDPDNVEKALEKLNRYEINGRELVVKEDHGESRDQYGRIVREGGGGGGGGGGSGGGGNRNDRMDRSFNRRNNDDDRLSGRNHNVGNMMMSNDYNNASYNSYGLSASFLESLGINGPLHNKVFVANLDYKVDSKKLKQVFKLAGKVQSVDLSKDKEGNSRGFAVIEYDHPVEAVQAISMLDRQMLFDRRMTVRLDRIPDKGEGIKLPEGLGGVGIGLGPNGEPLKDVARNIPSITNQQQNQQQQVSQMSGNSGNLNLGGGMFSNNLQPSPVAPVSVNKQGGGSNLLSAAGGLNLGNLSSSNLAALTNVVGGLGAALSNPLLSSSLSNLGLNLGQSPITPNNDDSMSKATALTNNYSTGNNYSSSFGGGSGYNLGGGGSSSGGGGGGVGVGSVGSGGNFDNLRNVYNSGVGPQDNSDFNPGSSLDMYGGGGGSQNQLGGGAGGRKSDTIIIKNIPLSCTWQTLRDKFRDVGEVKFAEIRGNDVGVVRFFKERDAELAIALMDGSRMDGRTIQVSFF